MITILIVDDSKPIHYLYKMKLDNVLTKNAISKENVLITSAWQFEEAKCLLLSRKFDFIIFDWCLDKNNTSFELLKLVNKTPYIIVSGWPERARAEVQDTEFKDSKVYLKPLEVVELEKHIKGVMDGKNSPNVIV